MIKRELSGLKGTIKEKYNKICKLFMIFNII